MALSRDDKDEIKAMIAREIKDFVKSAVKAAENRPVESIRESMSHEGVQARKAEKQLVRQVGKAIIDAADKNFREASARIVEKTDPERAKRIRKLVPEF